MKFRIDRFKLVLKLGLLCPFWGSPGVPGGCGRKRYHPTNFEADLTESKWKPQSP